MGKIKKIFTGFLSIALFTGVVYAKGDSANIKKLSGFKNTGTAQGEVIPQDTKFAENIKNNILPQLPQSKSY